MIGQLKADLHCHTVASTHAYSTVRELAYTAAEKNLEIIGITDHGIGTADAPDISHFYNLKILPEKQFGVRLLKGVEANLIDLEGRLDMPEDCLKGLELVIAGYHSAALRPGTVEENTKAYINVLQNPYVDILAHCGSTEFPFAHEKVLATAKEYDKIIEVNESSFTVRKKSIANCYEILRLCKKEGIRICVNSDAHYCGRVGVFPDSIRMLEELDFPESLILNTEAEKVYEYLHEKTGNDTNHRK